MRPILLASFTVLCAFAVSAGEGGTLTGTVKLDGDIPKAKAQALNPADAAACKCAAVQIDDLVVDATTKGIQWAIIRIMDVKAETAAPPEKPPEIDQKGCKFSPRVTIVTPGGTIKVLNPDGIGHNVRTLPTDAVNAAMNDMMGPAQSSMIIKASKLKEPELIQLECNIHSWMKGYIVVHDPRYAALSGKDGKFEIKDIPPGKYKVSIFQEALGDKPAGANADGIFEVEIKAGAPTDMGEIKFKAK